MLIAIIDQNQSEFEKGTRQALAITNHDGHIMSFNSVEEIREIAKDHILNGFQWWAFDMDTGEAEEV